ncbi:MAG: STAS domain-containing protein [Ignavibacteria bacterium]|nr:STAS domain-containing protein [Ignavibacteria bacterium]
MSFDIEEINGITIIVIHQKRATAEIARDFKDFLFDLIERKQCRKMLLNLQEVQFMDSFFLGAIVSGLKKMKNLDGDIRIARLQKSLVPVFELMHLDEVFVFYDSIETALEQYSGSVK